MLLQEAVQQFVFEAVICISSGFCGPNNALLSHDCNAL
jgi:hypothetical protein